MRFSGICALTVRELIRVAVVFVMAIPAVVHANDTEVACKGTGSVDQARRMIEALPDDDIWWVAYGPRMAWYNKNLHRFMPTVNVYRGGEVAQLETAIDDRIGKYPVETPDGELSFAKFLKSEHSTTMGLVILRKGRIVFESYPRQASCQRPIFWSVTKVFVSALVSILEDEGHVDVSKPVEFYVPDLQGSSFKGITVRNVLDMATGLDCKEDYADRSSCYYRLAITLGDGYYTPESPDDPYALLSTLKVDRFAPQGTSYAYSSVNTFVLGWLVEEVTGLTFQDALSKYIWTQMGAAHDAAILAPRYGVPITYGGLLATLRDVARFGLLHTPSRHLVAKDPVLSARYISLLKDGGNPALMENARYAKPAEDVDHNAYQWDAIYDNNDMFKGGWAGQGLLVNPDKDIVAVYTGYMSEDGTTTELRPLLRTMLKALYPRGE